ncbi:pollen receptor-like kinase 2 [Cucurbita pepo subsp. pepo]|uniref:pollen receptor-like kinase 2 n=1 Tax=Cucurbita pepo subsp. pepo TaxID=3664 RepID=UPI000C9D3BC0|nr:pollen receptor-like kinase 2 [Cucurbita pepo subsp. pepo]
MVSSTPYTFESSRLSSYRQNVRLAIRATFKRCRHFPVCCNTSSSTSPEAEILIKFKSSLSNNTSLDNWDTSINICNDDPKTRGKYWTGVTCKDGTLFGLRLENLSLGGVIDIDTLVNLPSLRSLSFMNNSFHGTMPKVKKLGALRALYLAYNKFSGTIPEDAFENMRSLKTVRLEENEFKGEIPGSLSSLPALVELSLEGNRFEGKIPDFIPRDWKLFDLSNNLLEGPIPSGLAKIDSNAFAGNKDLCGQPLSRCKSPKKWYILTGVTVGIVLVAVIVLYHRYRRRRALLSAAEQAQNSKAQDQLGLEKAQYQEPTEENAKLQFVRADSPFFDLEELLRAPAEVLGGGSFGSSYKALLSNGPPVVVKRLRPMRCVGFEEFHEHMKRLGIISHPNLLPPVAFYYRNEDKLLISEFMGNGNLADHLHGHAQRTPENIGLDWPTRLRIIKGVGRGLAHLHSELPSLSLPHGHLKSSNILLNSNYEPLLTDFGLDPLVCQDQAQQYMAAYKSPEFIRHRRVSRKTDVWSLGILILELLTGKFPANYLRHGGGAANGDLAAWVKSAVREEWTAEVFDGDMMKGTKNEDGEMVRLLRIGMICSEEDEDRRWGLKEAVEKIEELKETEINTDDEFYSSYGSEVEARSVERE